MKKNILIIFLSSLTLMGLCSSGLAQQFNTGTNFLLSVPQQEYKDVVGDVGYGIGGYMLYSFRNKPLKMGAQIAYLVLGSVSENVSVNGDRARVKSTSNALLVTFLGRLQKQKGFFRPYAEGVLGFQNLNSNIATTSSPNSSVRSGFNDDTQFMLTYGAGVGTWISLKKPSRIGYIGGLGRRGMFLDLSVTYLKTGKADFLKKDSISVSGDEVIVERKGVETNMLMFTIGVIFGF